MLLAEILLPPLYRTAGKVGMGGDVLFIKNMFVKKKHPHLLSSPARGGRNNTKETGL
jgi:hypothetical protein